MMASGTLSFTLIGLLRHREAGGRAEGHEGRDRLLHD